jgi:Sigma-54 interaction domain
VTVNAIGTVLSQAVGPELISSLEWRSLCTRQHNVLFEGPAQATEGLLRLLEPHLRLPAIWKGARTPLEIPMDECGALVLQNVSSLDRREQAALLRWLGDGRRQVVSTTDHSLLPLIARGVFDEVLYYRLNVTLIRVESTGASV